MSILTINQIQRATVAAWALARDFDAYRRSQTGTYDIIACSRTAYAEIYRYDDLRDVPQPVWCFQTAERRHTPADLAGESYPHGLIASGADTDYPTWRECFDAALAAVRALRTGTP